MAAGLGFKDFTTGEVLTAADVDGYLMQGIWVFASAAARNAAVTSPQEGNFAFTKDTNSLWYYDGAAWVASGATGDIEGVTAGVGISGGGTSGTVTVTNSMATEIAAKGDLIVGTGSQTFDNLTVGTNGHTLVADSSTATGLKWAAPASGGGMTLINSGGTALSGQQITISSIPGTYTNLYIVVVAAVCAGNANTSFRLNSDTGNNYTYRATKNSTVIARDYLAGVDRAYIGLSSTNNGYNNIGRMRITIDRYADTAYKQILSDVNFMDEWWSTNNSWDNTAAITSFTIFADNAGGFSSGTIYVYGVN